MDYHEGNVLLTLLPASCDSPLMWLLSKSAFIFGVAAACEGLTAADSWISCSEKQQQESPLVTFSAQRCSAAIQGSE